LVKTLGEVPKAVKGKKLMILIAKAPPKPLFNNQYGKRNIMLKDGVLSGNKNMFNIG